MLGGAVQSGFQLALTRVGVAVGEAGSTPAAHAYVARNFPPERRAAPLAVITLAIPLASAASLIGGGLLAESLGWRTAFVVMGLISVLFAPVVIFVLGRRQDMPAEQPQQRRAVRQGVGSVEEAQLPCNRFWRGLHLVRRLFVDDVRARVSGAHQGNVARRGRPAVRGGQRPDRHRGSAARRPSGRSLVAQGHSVAAVAGGGDDRGDDPVLGVGVRGGQPAALCVVHRAELRRRNGVHGTVHRGHSTAGTCPNNARRLRRSFCSSARSSERLARS